jgi:cell division protein FtsZ
MDELTMITEYIQGQAGDECEVIFGHGLDSTLGEKIRVTVIATGFSQDEKPPVKKKEEKKVMDLEKPMEVENKAVDYPREGNQEIQLKENKEAKPFEKPVENYEEEYTSSEMEKSFFDETVEEEKTNEPEAKVPEVPFEVDFTKVEEPPQQDLPVEETPYVYDLFSELDNEPVAKFHEDEIKDAVYGDEELFPEDDDEFEIGKSTSSDEIIDDEGLMRHRKTKERLEQQRKERAEKFNTARKQEMSKEEFNDKWHKAAYQRRGVKLESAPHSSDAYISRYNLNDDNNLLGNNKFLHDNVD